MEQGWRVRRTSLILLGLLAPQHVSAAEESCVALSDMIGRLNPGFWAPSFVFTSLQVRPGAVHPPNLTRAANSVEMVGACDPSRFRADSFVWQKPTSDGGDWIATTAARPMQITVDGVPCALTGLAVTTFGWPSLRLQFEECPRKTALQVSLVNASANGFKLVHWMCKVAVDSELCTRAAEKLPPKDSSTAAWPNQLLLDLGQLAAVASQGATRFQIYNNCYENLDWYVVNTPLGIESSEFEMLLSMRPLLAPTFHSDVRIEANVVVETVCMPDCSGKMAERCYKRDFAAEKVQKEQQTSSDADESVSFAEFVEILQDEDLKPWGMIFFGSFFGIGSLLALCGLKALTAPPKKPERRIKQVAVSYHDVPETSTAFFR